MKNPPCIRGLKEFKKGCPQVAFNPITGHGCPAWITKTMPSKKDPDERETISQCLDLWMLVVNWDANVLLEGNQQAIETFRNGSIETDEMGRRLPKTPQGLRDLVAILREEQYRRQIVTEHETQKRLSNDS